MYNNNSDNQYAAWDEVNNNYYDFDLDSLLDTDA